MEKEGSIELAVDAQLASSKKSVSINLAGEASLGMEGCQNLFTLLLFRINQLFRLTISKYQC